MARSSGTWKPGTSGNPTGRKPGDAAITRARKIIAAELPAIIRQLATMAKAGDVAAAKILIDRLLPPARADLVETSISRMETAGPVSITRTIRSVADEPDSTAE